MAAASDKAPAKGYVKLATEAAPPLATEAPPALPEYFDMTGRHGVRFFAGTAGARP